MLFVLHRYLFERRQILIIKLKAIKYMTIFLLTITYLKIFCLLRSIQLNKEHNTRGEGLISALMRKPIAETLTYAIIETNCVQPLTLMFDPLNFRSKDLCLLSIVLEKNKICCCLFR